MASKDKLTIIRWVDNEKIPALLPLVREKQNVCIREAQIHPTLSFGETKESGGKNLTSLKLTVQIPKITPWSLVSLFDPKKERIVFVEPKYENEYGKNLIEKNNDNKCDACVNNHSTLFALLVNHDGFRNVALSCLDEDLGIEIKDSIIKFTELFSFFLNDEEWDIWVESAPSEEKKKRIPLIDYFAGAVHFTNTEGFVKSDSLNSTKERVLTAFQNGKLDALLTPDLISEAESIIQFYKSINSESNYVKGIQSSLSSDALSLDNNFGLGIIASAPSTYYKKTGREKALNAPFAEEKQRGRLKLRVNSAEVIEDIENPVVKYRLSDDEGRKFVWRATWPGKEEMRPGVYVYLTGTIKAHTHFHGVHYTMLSRCVDVEVVSRDSEKPDFYKSANKRAYKEEFLLSLVLDYKGKGLGSPAILVTRSWKENNKINKLECIVPALDVSSLLETVHSTLVLEFGIKSSLDKWKKAKKNALFVAELNRVREILLFKEYCIYDKFYIVDSALNPRHSPRHYQIKQKRLPKSDGALSYPRLFTSRGTAERHGKRLKHGRLSVYNAKEPRILPLPYALHLSKKEEQERKFSSIDSEKYDFIAYFDIDFQIKRLEPFELSSSENFELESVSPIHESFRIPERKQSKRLLQGVKIVVLTAEFGKEKCIRKVTDYAKEQAPEGYNFIDCEKDLTKPFSLDEILCEELPNTGKANTLVVSSSREVVYYLRMYGAKVHHFHIGVNDKEPETIFIPSHYTDDIFSFGVAFVERLGVIRDKL